MSPWLSDLLLRSQTDERLIALSQLGHRRAFELIAERYRRPLTAYARRIDPNRAEDLVQQTFLSALSALQGGAEVRHLRGWLFEILRNQARREYASSPALAELEETDSVTESAQQVAERRMLAMDALGAVAQLPERQHDAIVQMAFHGRSRTEVADSMGLSEGAVRQLVHRARAAVRTAVTAVTPIPVMRWVYGPKSGSAGGLTDVTLGAGTASGAGIALKIGVGAILASGVVATGVISAVNPHHPTTRLASRSPSAAVQSADRSARASAVAAGSSGVSDSAFGRSPASGGSGRRGARISTAHGRSGINLPTTATVGHDGATRFDNGGSRSGSSGSGGGGGSSGSGRGGGDGGGGSDHGSSGSGSSGSGSSGSGSAGPGSGDQGSSGSDGGSSGGGGGTDGGSGSSGGGGTDGSSGSGGGGSQPGAVTSGHDGGGSGMDGGGLGGSGGGGAQSSGSDGGGLSGSSGGLGSASSGSSGSDGGSSSSGSSGSSSGSNSGSSSGSDSGSHSGH